MWKVLTFCTSQMTAYNYTNGMNKVTSLGNTGAKWSTKTPNVMNEFTNATKTS